MLALLYYQFSCQNVFAMICGPWRGIHVSSSGNGSDDVRQVRWIIVWTENCCMWYVPGGMSFAKWSAQALNCNWTDFKFTMAAAIVTAWYMDAWYNGLMTHNNHAESTISTTTQKSSQTHIQPTSVWASYLPIASEKGEEGKFQWVVVTPYLKHLFSKGSAYSSLCKWTPPFH